MRFVHKSLLFLMGAYGVVRAFSAAPPDLPDVEALKGRIGVWWESHPTNRTLIAPLYALLDYMGGEPTEAGRILDCYRVLSVSDGNDDAYSIAYRLHIGSLVGPDSVLRSNLKSSESFFKENAHWSYETISDQSDQSLSGTMLVSLSAMIAIRGESAEVGVQDHINAYYDEMAKQQKNARVRYKYGKTETWQGVYFATHLAAKLCGRSKQLLPDLDLEPQPNDKGTYGLYAAFYASQLYLLNGELERRNDLANKTVAALQDAPLGSFRDAGWYALGLMSVESYCAPPPLHLGNGSLELWGLARASNIRIILLASFSGQAASPRTRWSLVVHGQKEPGRPGHCSALSHLEPPIVVVSNESSERWLDEQNYIRLKLRKADFDSVLERAGRLAERLRKANTHDCWLQAMILVTPKEDMSLPPVLFAGGITHINNIR